MLPFLEKKDTDLFVYEFRDFGFPAHFHDSMEIICVESGEIILSSDSRRFSITAGNIAVVFPGRIHFYESGPDKNNSGFILLLGPKLLGEYKKELGAVIPQCPVFPAAGLHPDCLHAMETLRRGTKEGFRVQKAYAQLFLCRMLPGARLVAAPPSSENVLYPLINYMEEHFRENISLEDAASALYINKYRLSGIFSRILGINFNDYLNSLRINLAMQLIDTSENSMTEIAFEVGFLNVRTFNRAFKKNTGITPSEYKKARRK